MLTQQLLAYTSDRLRQNLHRQRVVSDAKDKDKILSFSSNDYLSLGMDSRLKYAYQYGFEHYATGSGGSMVVNGYHASHQSLEKAFAQALGVDDCLLFSSGYAANLSLIELLAQHKTHLLIDKMVHASVYDGLRFSGASYSRYQHNCLDDLTLKIQKAPDNSVMMTEGVFSMSGELAPLADIALAGKHLQGLVVDEAHAFGVFGPQGMGTVMGAGLTQHEVPLRVIPLGKAYAGMGAIVAGNGVWIDALLQSARPYIYSTAVSPAYAYGLLKTLDVIREADDQRAHLQGLVCYFRGAIKKSSLCWSESQTPIQQLQLGCTKRALDAAKKLQEASIVCMPMRPPTVSNQKTGLRVILNAHHQPKDIDRLFRCLETL